MLVRKIYLSIRPSNDYIYNVYSLSLLWNKYKPVTYTQLYTIHIFTQPSISYKYNLYVQMYVHPVYPNQPHMHPREDTLKRRTGICTREDTLLVHTKMRSGR